MKLKILMITDVQAVIEIEQYGIWETEGICQVFLNGTKVSDSKRTVQTISGLIPQTDYEIWVTDGIIKSNVVSFTTNEARLTLNVKAFGAAGDGKKDDTLAIQAAIASCPVNGKVYFPSGQYAVTSIFLRSNLMLEFDSEATLLGNTKPEEIPILPGLIAAPDGAEELNLGSWEGNPLEIYASLITGIGVENVLITGSGTLDGCADESNWWQGDGRSKIGQAWRPRMIFLNRCKNITIHGLTIKNSPSWNIHPYYSEQIKALDLSIISDKYSPNTDGINPESVDGLLVAGVYFSVGDDCIAVKSGKKEISQKFKVPSKNIEIRQCLMEDGHGALTLGSELSAGIYHLICRDCYFKNTDRGFRIKTRRGRGRDAIIDDIHLTNIRMNGVMTPFSINSFYNRCDPDGHSSYVQSRDMVPVDDNTPSINRISIRNIKAVNCHVAGAFLYGLPESKIKELVMSNVSISFAEHTQEDYPDMMDDLEPCDRLGLYAANVSRFILENVGIEGQRGDPYCFNNIDELLNV